VDWDGQIETILKSLESAAGNFRLQPRVEDLGRVRQVGDGVALVEGLTEATINEVVVFANGTRGEVLDLGKELVGCVLYGPEEGIPADSPVVSTGQTPSVPVGERVLGRVMNALGQPRDDLGPIECTERRSIEQEAPGPLQRQPVKEPLFTGVKLIDAVVPIGLGQRELILGDRETGKTSLALDAIVNQKDSGVVCIYVSIGQKRASVLEVLETLRSHQALGYSAIVVADAEDPAPLQYLAPYSGCALAEWFAYQGRHALVIYDDLTRHAEAYRQISLILRRSPGREAYPGDIFSVHARLMERGFKLSDGLGGGSVTALPIVETQRGNISGFIPTNLISMTDGQLFLDSALFAQGQLPAIDIGRSVSRVGRDAQPGTVRDAAANLRLESAQYEEVKGFSRFGAILDESTSRQIARGERLVRLLTQTERQVMPLSVQVAEFWALKSGLLDVLESAQLTTFEQQLRRLAPDFGHLDSRISSAPAIDNDLAQDLRKWVDQAKARLSPIVEG
jgi:F-type H+-transporting ATPase subunit alpha